MTGIGFVTINNYPKLIDIWVACGAFALGWLMVYIRPLLKRDLIENAAEDFQVNWVDWIGLYVVFALLIILTKKGSQFLSLMPPILVYVVCQHDRLKGLFCRFSKFLLLGVALFVATQLFGTFSAVAVLSCILLVIYFKSDRKAFILLCAGFFLARHSGGEFPIEDTFHAAEHFLSNYLGAGEIFSNLGYAEEVPPFVLDDALRKIGLGIPMNEAIIVCAFIFKALIFFIIYKRSPLLAFLSFLALPEDRVSLLFAILVSLTLASEYTKAIFKVALIAVMPLYFSTLSPPYFAVVCVAATFCFFRLDFKYMLFAGLLLTVSALASYSEMYPRFITYLDFSDGNIAEHGTPMGRYYVVPNLVRLMIAGLTGYSLAILFKSENQKIAKWLTLIIFLVCGYVYIGYAFNRIDPGYGRIVPVAIGFFLVAALAIPMGARLGTFSLIFIIAMYPQFGFTDYMSRMNDKEWKISGEYLQWSDNNRHLAKNINEAAKGSQVVLYGMSPGLLPLIKNGAVPYFTTPWVTSGKRAQETVVAYLKENPHAIIVLGHSFVIQDGVDVRARAPLVFSYIKDRYKYRIEYGIIFAEPKENCCSIGQSYEAQPVSLGKTGMYYSRWARSLDEFSTVDLKCNPEQAGLYHLKGSGLSYKAYLECGDGNKFPRSLGVADGIVIPND